MKKPEPSKSDVEEFENGANIYRIKDYVPPPTQPRTSTGKSKKHQSRVVIYIPDTYVEQMKDLKISPASLCEKLLEWYFSNEDDRRAHLLVKIDTLREQIRLLNLELTEYNLKKRTVERLEIELRELITEYNESSESLELQSLLTYLNRRIIMYKYNIPEIEKKQHDVLKKIMDHNPTFNLVEYVNRLRLEREDRVLLD